MKSISMTSSSDDSSLNGLLSAHALFSKLQVGMNVELFWTSNNNQGTLTSPRKRLQLWIRPQVTDDDLDRRRRRGVGASRKGDVVNNFVKFWQFSCCQRRNLLPLFYPQELTGVGFVLFLVSSSFFIFVSIQAPETISAQSLSNNFSSVVAMTVTPSVRNICNTCGLN